MHLYQARSKIRESSWILHLYALYTVQSLKVPALYECNKIGQTPTVSISVLSLHISSSTLGDPNMIDENYALHTQSGMTFSGSGSYFSVGIDPDPSPDPS
jgi:hypothetical protein